jgi:hypothetical protein
MQSELIYGNYEAQPTKAIVTPAARDKRSTRPSSQIILENLSEQLK